MMERKALSTRDDFEYWLVDMDDAIERFMSGLPPGVGESLDFSLESLASLEGWLLERYPDIQATREPSEAKVLDGVARYIGETYRKTVGGHWNIELDDPRTAFFGIPILTDFEPRPTPVCPLALATAATDRRTGKMLQTVLENILKRTPGNR